MTSIREERVRLGQADGTEIELVVSGDEDYAHYESLSGHAVILDESGMFVFARVVGGRFVSTGVRADQPPPEGLPLHGRESPEVRAEKSRRSRGARGHG